MLADLEISAGEMLIFYFESTTDRETVLISNYNLATVLVFILSFRRIFCNNHVVRLDFIPKNK